MRRKTDIEMAKTVAIKRLRARVRLEAAVRADVALNDILPAFEEEFDRRVESGEPYELTSYDQWVIEQVNLQLAPPRG